MLNVDHSDINIGNSINYQMNVSSVSFVKLFIALENQTSFLNLSKRKKKQNTKEDCVI